MIPRQRFIIAWCLIGSVPATIFVAVWIAKGFKEALLFMAALAGILILAAILGKGVDLLLDH